MGILKIISDRNLANNKPAENKVLEEKPVTEFEYDDFVYNAISCKMEKMHKLETEILNLQRYYLQKERYKQYPNLVIEYFARTDGLAYCKPRETTIGFNAVEMTVR